MSLACDCLICKAVNGEFNSSLQQRACSHSGVESEMQRCSACYGSGVDNRDHEMPPVKCYTCNGAGRVQIYASPNENGEVSDSAATGGIETK